MKLLHGSSKGFTLHAGLCLTDDVHAARAYAEWRGNSAGTVTTVDLALAGLRVVEGRRFCEGSGDACGDTREEIRALRRRRVDVVVFDDEAPGGRRHRTWRLISERALRAVTV